MNLRCYCLAENYDPVGAAPFLFDGPSVDDCAAIVLAAGAPHILLALNKQRWARCDRHLVSAVPEKTCPVCTEHEDAFTALFG